MRLAWLAATTLVAFGCGDNRGVPDARTDSSHAGSDAATGDAHGDGALTDANPLEPGTLADTGLCMDAACATISPAAHEYAPQYVLYADLASKRRWIELPAGTQIDTSDMDHWVFPQGTKIWKEFTAEDGTRIETRYMAKVGTDESRSSTWFFMSYEWNAAQNATVAVPNGVVNANGTAHDIPSQGDCANCHNKLKPGHVLGFGALSLDFHQADASVMDLDDVVAAGMLNHNPPGNASPHYPLPTDATAADKAALGYLHANCGHCHNPSSPIAMGQTPINLRMDTLHLAHFAATGLAATTIDVAGTSFALSPADCPPPGVGSDGTCPPLTLEVKSGDSAHSILFARFAIPDLLGTSQHMPAAGVKTIDAAGKTILQTWIDSL